MGAALGFRQLGKPTVDQLVEETSGGQTVALHTGSELLKGAAGSSAFLYALRAKTGMPMTLASKWLGRFSAALIVADATFGFYKEGKEILNCQAGD